MLSLTPFVWYRFPGTDPRVVLRRGQKAGDHQLPHPETRADGLFCERIFGPTKDGECHCGKYKKIRYKGKICDRCGVEVTRASVRRERRATLNWPAPVSHIWYFKGIPSRMGLCWTCPPGSWKRVLYFAAYIVTDPGYAPLVKNQILSEKEYRDLRRSMRTISTPAGAPRP